MKMIYTNYIALDLDSKNPRKLYKVFNTKFQKVSVYKTKHGFHVLIYLPHKMRINNKYWKLRQRLGDDPKKIFYDKKNIDVESYKRLFTQKKKINEHIDLKSKNSRM